MKSIKAKNGEDFNFIPKTNQSKKSKKAFTLVELIIVITILAILAIVAFVSFREYIGNARDGNKLTTLSNIEKGLTLYNMKTGNYPNPDNVYGSGNYSGILLSEVGFIGTRVAQGINMNKVPKDPIVQHEYTYGLSKDKKYYQLGSVLENNQSSIVSQTYANNYISKVIGNYKGLMTFSTGGINYISNLPSLIFTQTGIQNFEDGNNPKFVINNGGNLVKPYDINNAETVETTLEKLTQTGSIQLRAEPIPSNLEAWNTQSGTLKTLLGYSEDEIGASLYGEKYYTDKQNISGGGGSSSSSSSSSSTSSSGGPTNTPPTIVGAIGNVEQNEGTALNISVVGKFSDSEGGALSYTATNLPSGVSINETTGAITGTLPNVVSDTPYVVTVRATDAGGLYVEQNFTITVKNISQWKDETGTFCNNDDYVFTYNGPLNGNTSKTYRWAGCNSALGEGFERGKQNNGTNGTIGSCYSYDTNNNTSNCPIATSGNAMYSTKTEYDWNTAKGTNNIWGKLYTYAQASATTNGACPSGWHLPTDTEWEILETYLNTTVKVSPRTNCRNATDGWLCPGLGWSGNTSRNIENNIIQALKIPLAGNRNTDGVTFRDRGNIAYLWSSGASTRNFNWNFVAVSRTTNDTSRGFSVRCLKD